MALFWWCWAEEEKQTGQKKSNRHEGAARREMLIRTLFGAALALFCASLLALVLPCRPRPRIVMGMEPNLSPGWDQWSAFPSDHASLFFALAAGFWRLDRGLGWLALAHAAVVVSLPRVYLGLHYATDILAGAALGIGCTWLTMRSAWAKLLVTRLLAWEKRWPRAFLAGLFVVTYLVATLFTDLRKPANILAAMIRGKLS